MTFLNILIILALASVVVVLLLGFYALYRGGEFGRKWSNRLMRYRIAAQAITIILILIGVWLIKAHRG
jgi:hypothetical protein